MIIVPFEFDVWYRHRGNTKYIPARVHNALQAGHRILVRYRDGDTAFGIKGFLEKSSVWNHIPNDDDIMAYQIVEKK